MPARRPGRAATQATDCRQRDNVTQMTQVAAGKKAGGGRPRGRGWGRRLAGHSSGGAAKTAKFFIEI